MQIEDPKCIKRSCRHVLGIKEFKGSPVPKLYCKAFPNGIPYEIANGNNRHYEPFSGQGNDVVYEKGEMFAEEEGEE